MSEILIAPNGIEVLVGTPTEREQLLAQGYKTKPAKPAAKSADVEAEKPAVKRTTGDK